MAAEQQRQRTRKQQRLPQGTQRHAGTLRCLARHTRTPVAFRQICRTEAPTAFPTGPNTEGVGAGRVRVKTEASVGENDRRRRASSALRPKHTGRVARTASSHYLPRAVMVLVLAAEAALSRLAMRCRSATVSCWIRSSFCWYIITSRARYLPRRAPLVRPGARPASACACLAYPLATHADYTRVAIAALGQSMPGRRRTGTLRVLARGTPSDRSSVGDAVRSARVETTCIAGTTTAKMTWLQTAAMLADTARRRRIGYTIPDRRQDGSVRSGCTSAAPLPRRKPVCHKVAWWNGLGGRKRGVRRRPWRTKESGRANCDRLHLKASQRSG